MSVSPVPLDLRGTGGSTADHYTHRFNTTVHFRRRPPIPVCVQQLTDSYRCVLWRIIAIAHLFMLGEPTYALVKFTHTLLKLNDAKCLRDNKHVTGIAGIGIGDCLRLMIMRIIEYRPPNLFAPTIKFSSPRKGA